MTLVAPEDSTAVDTSTSSSPDGGMGHSDSLVPIGSDSEASTHVGESDEQHKTPSNGGVALAS
jgi:hypothetical protein